MAAKMQRSLKKGTESKGSTPLTCHVGGTLHNLARFYPTMSDVIDELIQNALDAGANLIHLRVRLGKRFVSIRDNGVGMGRKTFDTKVSQSIGRSIKSAKDLGQFGIGFISPVGKCDHFTVTSCPKPQKNTYTTWTFKVRPDDATTDIPWQHRKDLSFAPDAQNSGSGANVWWRTSIEVFDFLKDDAMMNVSLDSIIESALMRYSAKMEKNGASLKVEVTDLDGNNRSTKVKASTFTGTRLKELNYNMDPTGKVAIRMYLAKKRKTPGGGRVNIKFGELGNDFRFPFSNFRNSTAKDHLPKEVMEALGSGIFEGEILGEKVKLSPSRSRFEQNDALVGLCVCIEEWFAEQGKARLEDQRENRRMERYQQIGLDAISQFEQMLRTSEHGAELKEALRQFLKGTAGNGHSKIRGVTQDEKSLANSGGRGKKRKPAKKPTEKKPVTGDERDIDHLSVKGPKGSKRKLVKGGSNGLQYSFGEYPESPKLWELNTEEGLIEFNTLHPDWAAIDTKGTSDYRLRSLIELVTLQAMTLLTMPDKSMMLHQRRFADRLISNEVQWLLLGGGNPTRRKRK